VGDDVELYTDGGRDKVLDRLYFLRQQSDREGAGGKIDICRSLADFVAPREAGLADTIGAFAVSTGFGLKNLVEQFKAANDDYNAIMAEAIADRLAEAFAECLHKRVRDEWGYGREEGLSNTDLIEEKYRGIRPAAGYPACPDHTEKGTLWRLLDVQAKTGIEITESFAMWPGSSVSGFYFAHPESRYFSLGKIDRDQVEDYAQRKGMSVKEVERWLGPNLNYEPGNA
jgi:5-methyltetrahydrofolate--homocysteine methyltransferase